MPADSEVVKLSGKYIVPGIIKRTRSRRESGIRAAAVRAYGITTVVSQGTDSGDRRVKTRQEQLKDPLTPRIKAGFGMNKHNPKRLAGGGARIDKDYGTLTTGKVADLLVLERNPLENISNMRTIQTIYLGGRKFE